MDIYDEADWTEMDIEDLKAAIECGASIEEAADLLCRSDSVDDVARKCEELGLKLKLETKREFAMHQKERPFVTSEQIPVLVL